MDLFDYMRENQKDDDSPLAKRMRPENLDEVIGQEHIIGKNKLLYRAIKADKLGSLIFYGPPGTGKTTLAMVIAHTTKADFKQINILYQNDEYSIVRANTTYGLNVYDYIVLDGSSVSDDQIITNIKKTDTGRTDIPTDSVEPGVSDNIPESTEPLPAETREEPTQETTQEATQESQTPES